MPKKELTPRQLKTIAALLECDSIEAVARKLKMSKATIYNWLKLDHFKSKLDEERDGLFEQGLSVIKGSVGKAAAKLIELLDSKDEKSRRLAAKEVIAVALKIVEIRELEERLSKLEELVQKIS